METFSGAAGETKIGESELSYLDFEDEVESFTQSALFLLDFGWIESVGLESELLLAVENCLFEEDDEFFHALNIGCVAKFIGERFPALRGGPGRLILYLWSDKKDLQLQGMKLVYRDGAEVITPACASAEKGDSEGRTGGIRGVEQRREGVFHGCENRVEDKSVHTSKCANLKNGRETLVGAWATC